MAGTKEEWDGISTILNEKDAEAMKYVQEGWISLNDSLVKSGSKAAESEKEDLPAHQYAERRELAEDVVNEPSHYTDVPAEFEHHRVMDAIGANYHFANAMKYLWRAGKKNSKGMSIADKEIQDIRKSIRYLQMWIELRQEAETREKLHAE